MKRSALIIALAVIFAACSGNQPKPITEKDAAEIEKSKADAANRPESGGYGAVPAAQIPAQPAAGRAPAEGGGADRPAGGVKLEKEYEANAKDEDTKKKLVQATYQFGNKVMLDNGLPPRVKYPTALKMFKRVLELDPDNQQAATDKKSIEDIYASM